MNSTPDLPQAQDGDRLRLEASLRDLMLIRAAVSTAQLKLADMPSGRFHLLSPAVKTALCEATIAIEASMQGQIGALDALIDALAPYRPEVGERGAPHLHVVRR